MKLASSERGTKRICPETGKKFYDLNQDPIVSPYTGKSYPRSLFEQVVATRPAPERARKVEEDETEDEEEVAAGPEIISLDEADAEETGDDIPEVEDVEDVEDLGDEEDVFLEEEDEDNEDIGFGADDEDER